MLKRNSFIILFIFIFFPLYSYDNNSYDNNFYSINKLISFLGLDSSYKVVSSIITIKKGKKSALLMLNSNFIYLGDKKIFLDEFTKSEQGEYFVANIGAIKLLEFFSDDESSYFLKDGEIYQKLSKKETLVDKPKQPYNIEELTTVSPKKEYKNNKPPSYVLTHKDSLDTKKSRINAIIIDPGHGDKDPGAVGFNNREKDIVLKVGLILEEKLKEEFKNKEIILTRRDDRFIELEERANISNKAYDKYGQTIFVSIHVNAHRSSNVYGFETWSLVSDYERKILKDFNVKDKNIEKILNSMINYEIYQESKSLAEMIQNGLEKHIGKNSKNRGIREEEYFVIKKSIMPSVLVEIGFVTNKDESTMLTNYSYLDSIANGILDGIKGFINEFEKSDGFRN